MLFPSQIAPMSAAPDPSLFSHLSLGGFRYLPITTSTNDEAFAWIEQEACDCSVIIADAQTQGRGRADHRWLTTPTASLAFSLILKPTPYEAAFVCRLTALAALALLDLLKKQFEIAALIKWPNDVLIENKKVAGILVENYWQQDALQASVIGMGINLTPASVPTSTDLRHPAACLQDFCHVHIERWQLLADLLQQITTLRSYIAMPAFLQKWNDALAYRGQLVTIHAPSSPPRTVTLLGIADDGTLIVQDPTGHIDHLLAADLSLSTASSSN